MDKTFLEKKNFSLSLLLHQKCLHTNKAAGIDTIPPKRAADFLTQLLTVTINKGTEENIFPDSAKIASVIPLDKGKPNKNEISNYKPVSVLNTFSKF